MIEARKAAIGDIDEIIRLRANLIHQPEGARGENDLPWRVATRASLSNLLAQSDSMAACCVVEKPHSSGGLAASAFGYLDSRLPEPLNLSGRKGHIGNVVTDQGFRRRGYASLCIEALLEWFSELGVVGMDVADAGLK